MHWCVKRNKATSQMIDLLEEVKMIDMTRMMAHSNFLFSFMHKVFFLNATQALLSEATFPRPKHRQLAYERNIYT